MDVRKRLDTGVVFRFWGEDEVSSAKKTPDTGALKPPPTPAATPVATTDGVIVVTSPPRGTEVDSRSLLLPLSGSWQVSNFSAPSPKNRDIMPLTNTPVSMQGCSGPSELPVPSVAIDFSIFTAYSDASLKEALFMVGLEGEGGVGVGVGVGVGEECEVDNSVSKTTATPPAAGINCSGR
eukprot:CAMPEP_0118655726 /NCGR_PEP_ID=MMETSP0785-20121206/13095_1 /TAXON_ID=91992 /ORGANISM="Bolidomonas pacifica, Strain CCMP 1866" /LENGTH=179 /DNA_ID=CAMNT_0006548509 /DNA_START=739 /DNA_END=1278 /DNA_ORIENTATION=-